MYILIKLLLLLSISFILNNCLSIDRNFETKNRIFIQSDKFNSIKLEINKNGVIYTDKTPAIIDVENSFNSNLSIKILEPNSDKKEHNLKKFDFGILYNLYWGAFGLAGVLLDFSKGYHWKYDSVYTIEDDFMLGSSATQSCHKPIENEFRPEYRRTVGVFALTIGSALFLGALTPSKCFHCSKSGENLMKLILGGTGLAMAFGGGYALKDDYKNRKTFSEWEDNTANKVLLMKESCSLKELK